MKKERITVKIQIPWLAEKRISNFSWPLTRTATRACVVMSNRDNYARVKEIRPVGSIIKTTTSLTSQIGIQYSATNTVYMFFKLAPWGARVQSPRFKTFARFYFLFFLSRDIFLFL